MTGVARIASCAALLSIPAAAEPLRDPVADRALDCAVALVLSGGDPQAALARAVAAESAATGAFSERLLPALIAEFARRAEAARVAPDTLPTLTERCDAGA